MIPRADALAALERDTYDLVVVGGGITGAGVALDAASRGYSVALLERTDFAAGTSSRSSKLIHGGLRYLEQYNFDLVREALTERGLLLQRIAPHLVSPVPFLFPMTHRVWEYFCMRLAFLTALFNILVQWEGLPLDDQGCGHRSIAPFSL